MCELKNVSQADVEPELISYHENCDYMGLKYDDVTAECEMGEAYNIESKYLFLNCFYSVLPYLTNITPNIKTR